MSNQLFIPTIDKTKDSTLMRLKKLKDNEEDFEWYPTTNEMIEIIINDIRVNTDLNCDSVLDVGCGDGRVLEAFHQMKDKSKDNKQFYYFYAIEKAVEHIRNLPDYITFLGAEFYETNLTNKAVDVLFCNPPYSDYENWSEQIIKCANAVVIYLVIPARWVKSEKIELAIQRRDSVAELLFEGGFSNAERKARANINIVRIVSRENRQLTEKIEKKARTELQRKRSRCFGDYEYRFKNRLACESQDPFSIWFDDTFPNIRNLEVDKRLEEPATEKNNRNELLSSLGTIDNMVKFYLEELNRVLENYRGLNQLDPVLFRELKIDLNSIKKTMKIRMELLTAEYWSNFINHYEPITNRLTQKYREKLHDQVIDKAKNIDFTALNALAITEMVIKTANKYSEEQIKDFFFELSNPKSIQNYKSNKKVFGKEKWRYQERARNHKYYKLDYRIIQHKLFNVEERGFLGDSIDETRLETAVNDVLVIAKLVGLPIPTNLSSKALCSKVTKTYGEKMEFYYSTAESEEILFTLRVFMNGNQHLTMSKDFALRLNVMVGKLLGWVTNHKQASEEMNLSKADTEKVEGFYQTLDNQTKIGYGNLAPMLGIDYLAS